MVKINSDIPLLPEGLHLPAIDPKAQGGWQGPDDLVISSTPLWPRPNRSWRWIIPWALMVMTCYIAVLVPTAMRNNLVAEAELAIARHMLSTSFMDVSSPATFWAWLHNKWLPHLNHYRSTFPPSGVLLYDMRQRPVIGAYGNAYIARPRPLEDPLKSDSNAALWGVGMVLRQHRVRMSNCSAALAAVDSLAPPEQREPSSAAETMRAGKCYEKTQLSWSDSWELTQYTTAVRVEFSVRECAQGCSELSPNGCNIFVTADGDGLLTARYTGKKKKRASYCLLQRMCLICP